MAQATFAWAGTAIGLCASIPRVASREARDATLGNLSSPFDSFRLKRKNIQYSYRHARPLNTAYFLNTSIYQFILSPFPGAHSEAVSGLPGMTPPIASGWTFVRASRPYSSPAELFQR